MDKKEALLPLTQSQLSLWTGQRMHPEVPLHNVVYTFDISGPIDEAAFANAFQVLIKQTDVLRAIFIEKEGIPYQSFQSGIAHNLEVIDFTEKTETSKIEDWIFERTQQPIDIAKQIFDTVLIKINDNRYLWFLKIHHLVTDAVSYSILYRRMESLYKKVLTRTLEKTEASPTFQNYVRFEERQQNDAENETYKTYWKDKVVELQEKPKLYGAKGNELTTAAKRIVLKLGKARSLQLRELAKRPEIRGWTEDLTLFNIFSTLYFSYLFRVSGQKKLAIGAPAHNRTERDFQKTAGLFIEVLPLHIEIEEDDTFNSLFQRIKLETNTYLRNARPGTATSETGRSFNAVLNFINVNFPDFNGFSTKAEWVHSGHMDSSHVIRCHVYDMNGKGEHEVAFDLNEVIFPEAIATKVPEHFLNLLDAFLKDINLQIGKPNLLSSEEKRVLLQSDSSPLEPQKSTLEHFEKTVSQRPNAIALQYGKEILTYSALNKKANQLAHYLQKKGIDERNKVALYFYRSSDYIISVLAVMKTGGTFIPIASDQPAKRIKYIVSNSECSILLTESKLIQNLNGEAYNILNVLKEKADIGKEPESNLEIKPRPENLAYILYTSGSTGTPKGVLISQTGLSNYLFWAKKHYNIGEKSFFALFTSIGFDLTITTTFLPLISGGRVTIYKESISGPDMSLVQVLDENLINTIKLTPSHLALFKGRDLKTSYITTMIVGGEDFKVQLAKSITSAFTDGLKIYNEYGPTEATVGCIVSEYDIDRHTGPSVPIGKPIANMKAYVLDTYKNPVPRGVVGELYLSGIGLADGYANAPELTEENFIKNPFISGSKMYRTGDVARLNSSNDFEYLGRTDDQIKLRGYRIELSDIETNLANHPEVENCAVVLVEDIRAIPEEEVVNCTKCGLPSNYPDTDFNKNGVCHLCAAFESYKEKAERYFKNDDELVRVLTSKREKNPNYDCISLLSGGKDSTYVLARIINMGLKVLAFTMDNGYISDQAKANIDRIVKRLGVDHIYGTTPHMNEIFVDSLHRHHNVCNGCFKTIYTLSTKIALEKEIPFIVTGLSRGQFFETRLTEELFWDDNLDTQKIDYTILEARKIYHQESDAVKRLLDTSMFDDDEVFEKVEFIDFYRFSDVKLEEMLVYLKDKAGWVRPTDTGRSTNCLINQVGIYVHKKDLGYSNYSFPYSWDVRLGHKTRDESLEEINEVIDEVEVKRIMQEIGYNPSEKDWDNNGRLVAYYTGNPDHSIKDLKAFISDRLPLYMVPTVFKHLDEIPLTNNGKVDKNTLKNLNSVQLAMDTPYTAPRNEIEELLEGIWKEVLQLKKVGIHDDFIAMGGHSLAAIRVTARINEEVEFNFPLTKVFELPTIEEYSIFIEETLTELLEK